jgi:hypothetical protein
MIKIQMTKTDSRQNDILARGKGPDTIYGACYDGFILKSWTQAAKRGKEGKSLCPRNKGAL